MNSREEIQSSLGQRSKLIVLFLALCGLGFLFLPNPDRKSNSTNSSQTDGDSESSADTVVLDADRQKFIWDIEHDAFELETHFGKPLLTSIYENRRDEILLRFADEFSGAIPDDSRPAPVAVGPVREQRLGEDFATVTVQQNEFVDWLLNQTSESVPLMKQAKLRVLNLDPTENDDQWLAELLFTWAGQTKDDSSRAVEFRSNVRLQFASDEDIKSAPIILEWNVASFSERFCETPLMDEVTEEVGLADLPLVDNWKVDSSLARQYWFQVAVDDFNRDGFPDIAVATFLGQPLLLRSDAGKSFTNIAKEMRLKSWPIEDERLVNLVAWIDYDNDDFPDLLMGDRLYHNEPAANGNERQFVDVTSNSGLTVNHHPMGATVVDYDCDGLLDLYLLYQENMSGSTPKTKAWVGDNQSGTENQLWRNTGDGKFENVTKAANAGGGLGQSFAAAWHFFDDDHFPDVYIANDFGNNVYLRNKGDGTFEDISEATGTSDFATSMGAAAGDTNNDGHPELYVANMYSKMGRRIIHHVRPDDYPAGIHAQIKGSCAGNRLYSANASRQFSENSESLGINSIGWAYAPVFTDFNADGWQDLYATTGFMSFDAKKPDG